MPAASQMWEGAVQVGTDSRMRLGEDSVQGNTGLLAELDGISCQFMEDEAKVEEEGHPSQEKL